MVLLATTLAVLAGCGGGSPADAGGGTGGGTTPPSTAPTLSLALLDSSGAATTALAAGAPLTVQATLKDAAGAPMPNTVISFTLPPDPDIATVLPSSALTNASGVAFSRLTAKSIFASDASQVSAIATLSGTTTPPTALAPFAIGGAAVDLALSISQAAISAYGTTSVTATVTLNGAPPSSPMVVQFTSVCVASGKAALSTDIQTINGVATSTYTDKGCGRTDTITASVGSSSKDGTITVAAPKAVNIQFMGTTPSSLLAIRGTGGVGYSTTATVTFKVVDIVLAGIAGQTVTFGLTTNAGGITLDGVALAIGSTISKQTGADGTVAVTVQSGTVPTSVWVTAALGTLTTQSNQLVISTGRPAQDSFSLAATTLNIDGGNLDGVETILTVRAADRMSNIVADGTTINFIAEGAQIVGETSTVVGGTGTTQSTCSTVKGACSVTLVSAEYRPRGDSEPSGLATANRVTVTAYALGEESFVDANGNNVFDQGESWDDLGDVFVDNNENRIWELGEQSIQFSASNISACPSPPANGKLDNAASRPGTCDGVWGQAYVRRSMVIVLSGNTAQTDTPGHTLSMGQLCNATFPIRVFDLSGNPMPFGTTLSLSNVNVNDSSVTTTTTTVVPPAQCPAGAGFSPASSTTNCVSITPAPKPAAVTLDSGATSTVPNTYAAGGTYHYVQVSGPAVCQVPVSGTFNLKVQTPAASSNTITIIPYTVYGY